MKTLVFATKNENKVREIKEMIKGYNILSLTDIGFDGEIDENADTTIGNATIKVKETLKFCKEKGLDYGVFGDDTGLFVKALGGEPGVHSARFGGIDHDTYKLQDYLLKRMEGVTDRSAYFECSIVYGDNKQMQSFVGRAEGEIATKNHGERNFGYDPVFYSYDLKKTFGEAEGEEKNSVSHRGKAVRQFVEFLNKK